ncbi:MAG: SNF2-related protein [Candidatus Cyclobacteriaceae bacterium M2_1C_046]
MKISAAQPFKIIYSLFQHEYLGYIFESFAVHLDDKGKLTLQHQNISSANAKEFASGLDETDYELIKLMDEMQQDHVIKKFSKKIMKPEDFFLKTYDSERGNKALQQEIESYMDRRRSAILLKIHGKMLFEMGNDGEPTWREIEILEKKATVLFHFRRNEENTHYFPTIKYDDQKVDFQYKGAYIICNQPAYMVHAGKLFHFEKEVDGKKLKPFLNKKFIIIPKNVEETYYNKFVAPLVASFDVYAKGFEINTETYDPVPILTFSELSTSKPMALFADNSSGAGTAVAEQDNGKMVIELTFQYGSYKFRSDNIGPVSVSVEKNGDQYTFHRIKRKIDTERSILHFLEKTGITVKNSRVSMEKSKAFTWFNTHREDLLNRNFRIEQKSRDSKKYFIGQSHISIEIKENIDWFDIYAVIKFGPYDISFKELRKYILKKQNEFELPNGEIAVIPDSWLKEYGELFFFAENGQKENLTLRKHHLSLVHDLKSSSLAKVSMERKLEKLRGFDGIDKVKLPKGFLGKLRPYQKSGFDWLSFLNKYKFGGCLADDMGLGKTVQTLALLQGEKEAGRKEASLLVMPTSLVYNWEVEAEKFTPELKVFTYTGTSREKNTEQFNDYDLILTSYGIVRLDAEILAQYNFNYIILDESQAIKNPASNIAKAVKKLNSRHKLILTGTPLENSTMDLWSQISFINPGLLGNQSFFKNEFLNPIEKKQDEQKMKKLHSIIKPFILRRHKSQVATELPEKIENVQYCSMTEQQEEKYEEAKAYYRNKIMGNIEVEGIGKSQLLLLQGLTRLRQIANHPKMVDEEYKGDSGKMEDILSMMSNAIQDNHKILIFSQFVKHLTLVRNHLDENKIPYTYLDGSTTDRKSVVNKFQNDPKIPVFLISLKAGGLGLNLTQADYVFLLDPWWNPAIEAQAIDRAHRIGQQNKVFTYKFISKNTVEEKILSLQQRKLQLARELVTTEESFIKSLTKDDIEGLFT